MSEPRNPLALVQICYHKCTLLYTYTILYMRIFICLHMDAFNNNNIHILTFYSFFLHFSTRWLNVSNYFFNNSEGETGAKAPKPTGH